MVEDFNLMFDNAQQYNRPDSRIYRDAVKLQKYVQNKAEEIMAVDDEVGEGGGGGGTCVFISVSHLFHVFSYIFVVFILYSFFLS